jgi:hypothetical protein
MKVSRALVEWPIVKTVGRVTGTLSPLIALYRTSSVLSGVSGSLHHRV